MEQFDTCDAALKTCPFCGKKVNGAITAHFSASNEYYFNAVIKCNNCKIEVSKSSSYCTCFGLAFNEVKKLIEEVSNAWNTRANE